MEYSASLIDQLYFDVFSSITHLKKGTPGSETMQVLMNIIMTSSPFSRDPEHAVAILTDHIGENSYLNLSDAECEQVYQKIKPTIMMIEGRKNEC